MLKLGYNLTDGHISSGERSHAELLRAPGEWDDTVRAIAFPERKAVYFRLYAPKWDGMGSLTAEELGKAFAVTDEALDAFIMAGLVKRSWAVYHWETDERRVRAFDVRL
jgi:hypothetical protein